MERAKVYSETIAVLDILGTEFIERIPKSLYNKILSEKSKYYNPIYDASIDLKDQDISIDTAAFLSFLHYSYWCDDIEEKQEIKDILEQNENKSKEKNRDENNKVLLQDEMFKKKEIENKNENENGQNIQNNVSKSMELEVKKEKISIFKKIKSLIKRIIGDKNG